MNVEFQEMDKKLYQMLREGARSKQIAHEHAEWFGEVIKQIYKDAFVHGWKHCVDLLEELEKDGKNNE